MKLKPNVHGERAGLRQATRDLYRASQIVEHRRRHARHVVGRLLEAATGRDLSITLNVPTDLRESPFVAPVLEQRTAHLQLRIHSSASLLYYDVNILRQVCRDYFRHPDCVPRADELVIDAGANIGCYSTIAALLEPTARVHAFEPLRSAHSRLVVNCRTNRLAGRIFTTQAALGSESGQLELVGVEKGRQGTLVRDLADRTYPSEMVSVMRLDHYIADQRLPAPGIIKLDVEGFEVEVLEGAEQALRQARLLVAEWHSTKRLEKVIRMATDAGYELLASSSDDVTEPVGIVYFRRPAGPLNHTCLQDV